MMCPMHPAPGREWGLFRRRDAGGCTRVLKELPPHRQETTALPGRLVFASYRKAKAGRAEPANWLGGPMGTGHFWVGTFALPKERTTGGPEHGPYPLTEAAYGVSKQKTQKGTKALGPVSAKNHPAPGVALAVLLTTFPAFRPELRFSGGSCGLANTCRGKKVGQ
jgi:hypothetical protein